MAQVRIAGVNSKAIEEASRFNDEFFEHLDYIFDAELTKKMGSAVIFNDVLALFSAEERKAWPRIDSGKREDGSVDEECNNPDLTKALDGKRTVWVSYFDTHVERSARGMAITAKIENLSDIRKQEKDFGKQLEIDGEISTLENQLASYEANYRRAIKLVQQVDRQKELYTGLHVAFDKDEQGNIKKMAEPVMCWPQELPLKGQRMTITEFLSLNFELPELQTETDPQKKWDMLLATKARGTPEEEEVDPDNIEINNAKRFETGAASMLYFLEAADGANVTRIRNMFDKAKDLRPLASFARTIVELSIEMNALAAFLKQNRPGGKGSIYDQAVLNEDEETGNGKATAT